MVNRTLCAGFMETLKKEFGTDYTDYAVKTKIKNKSTQSWPFLSSVLWPLVDIRHLTSDIRQLQEVIKA